MEDHMRINHNISALNTNMKLRNTETALSASLERLSSGYRINKAADDAAGLAISRKMKTQIDGLEQASRNGSDGISVIQTAEGALGEIEAMLQRMRELSVQAANDVNTTEDRAAIQLEINQLNQEIDRIAREAEFNTKSLLNGDIDNKSYSSNKNVNMIYLSDSVESGDYEITVTRDARQAVMIGADLSFSEIDEEEAGRISINGYSVMINEGDDVETAFAKIRSACDSINITAFFADTSSTEGPVNRAGFEETEIGGGTLVFMSNAYGSSQEITIQCNNPALAELFGLSTEAVTAKGVDAEAELGEGFGQTATVSGKGDVLYVTDSNGFEVRFQATAGAAGTGFTDTLADGTQEAEISDGTAEATILSILDAGPMALQVGANEGQEMMVRIPRVDPVALGTDKANVCTQKSASEAITIFDNAVNEISTIRARLGAYQNRLDHAIANLDTSDFNMTEAMSRIADVDMAKEMTMFTQQDVLEQAGTAMLAQANQRPENILSLLNS